MLPLGMDDSGLSPLLLKRLIDACVRLPYREALAHLACWSVKLSLNKTERLLQGYGEVFTSKSWDKLKELAKQALPQAELPCPHIFFIKESKYNKHDTRKKCIGRDEGK